MTVSAHAPSRCPVELKVARKLTSVAGTPGWSGCPGQEVVHIRLRFRRSAAVSSQRRATRTGLARLRRSWEPGGPWACRSPRGPAQYAQVPPVRGEEQSHKARSSQPHGAAGVPSASDRTGTGPGGLLARGIAKTSPPQAGGRPARRPVPARPSPAGWQWRPGRRGRRGRRPSARGGGPRTGSPEVRGGRSRPPTGTPPVRTPRRPRSLLPRPGRRGCLQARRELGCVPASPAEPRPRRFPARERPRQDLLQNLTAGRGASG